VSKLSFIGTSVYLLLLLATPVSAQENDTTEQDKPADASDSKDTGQPTNATKPIETTEADKAPADEESETKTAQKETEPSEASAGKEVTEDSVPVEEAIDSKTSTIGVDRFADTPELSDFRGEVRAFEAEYNDIRADIKRLVEYQRERRLSEVEEQFKRVIEDLTTRERERRADAIAQFERFVKRYPSEPKFTPSALLRLAQLHYERSEDIFFIETEKYDQQMNLFETADAEQAPEEPVVNYTRTIELFAQLIRDWPESKMLDGAYYMQGYCLSAMEQEEKALENFKLLVQRFPNSSFRQEAWWRIGEYYFDSALLAESIQAYQKVIEDKEGRFYDKGLYKLAWSYFRDDKYNLAINRFQELVRYSDNLTEKTGGGSDLRGEAVQYLAISIQEDDWDGDGEPDVDSGLPRIRSYLEADQAYEADVIREVIKLLFDNARYEQMVSTVRYYLERYPNSPHNPVLHDQMITALGRLFKIDEAFAERDVFARQYGYDSSWAKANVNDEAVLEQAIELVEQALILSAQKFHRDAQKASQLAAQGDAAQQSLAETLYASAAQGYRTYLNQYPRSKNAYDLKFWLADCLYGSRQFAEAVSSYDEVIADKADDKYLEKSAWLAALTREEIVKTLARDGELPAVPSLLGDEYVQPEANNDETEENDGKLIVIKPIDIPDAVRSLIEARKTYALLPNKYRNQEKSAQLHIMLYKTGEHYFDFKHYEEARKWFKKLIEEHPKSTVTQFAARRLIDTYREANDWQNVALWAERISKLDFGKDFGDELRTLEVGALFRSATLLFEQGEFQKAADEYIRLVNENPKAKDAPQALNNAAFAYEKIRKFESAGRVYERIVKEYPDSEFVENALFNLAKSHQKVFDYDKAIDTYARLFKEFPGSQRRADYLYLAADNLAKTGQYRKAASRYEEYARTFPNRDDTAETFFKAVNMYVRLKDDQNLARAYQFFVSRYLNDPEQNTRLLKSLVGQARILKKRKRVRQAKTMYQRVISEFNARGLEPGSTDAQFPAEAAFELVEYDFKPYETIQITGSLQNQGRIITNVKRDRLALKRRYQEIIAYKFMDWNIAALFRFGNIDELFAQKLYDVPLPTILSEDEQDAYREQLDEFARPIEESAIGAYEYAIKEARRNVIMNEWTVHIQTSLNKYKAEEYPLFKSEVRPDALLHTSNLFQFPVDDKIKQKSDKKQPSSDKPVEEKPQVSSENSTDSKASVTGEPKEGSPNRGTVTPESGEPQTPSPDAPKAAEPVPAGVNP
jgi:cellulose synthase operon protein C